MKYTNQKPPFAILSHKFHLLVVLACHLLISSNLVYAQNTGKITGTVTDESGLPLAAVTIREVGQTNVTVSNEKGQYSLAVKGSNPSLIFSYVGYFEQTVVVTDKTSIDITLERRPYLLDEVSIGYTTVLRKDLNSSVSSISGKQLEDVPLSSVGEALTGRLAGVQIVSAEGGLEPDLSIRVRGGNSITQDNSPLYIIDGVNVEEGLEGLSIQDIESIDVLKDAASTAIYGARGANGVIIVTTKKAIEGKPTVRYNPNFGMSKVANKYEVLTPYQYVRRQYERALPNALNYEAFVYQYGDDLSVYEDWEPIDWQDVLFGRTVFRQAHDIQLTGGVKDVKYRIGYNKHDQDGIMEKSHYTRDILNLRLDANLSKKLSMWNSVSYTRSKGEGARISDGGSSTYNLLRNVIMYRPLLVDDTELFDEFDEEYFDLSGGSNLSPLNPIAMNRGTDYANNNDLLRISGNLTYKFSNALTFRSTIGLTYSGNENSTFQSEITPAGRFTGQGFPMVSRITTKRRSLNNSNTLTYTKRFNKTHHFTGLLGQEILMTGIDNENLRLRFFPKGVSAEKALNQLSLGETQELYPQNNNRESRLSSFFTRLNYSYKNKYTLTGSYRLDGSSKFAPDYRWRSFPSISALWRISEEPFAKISFINDMKLRASYGTAGNNRIGDYLHLPTFETGPRNLTTGSYYYLNQDLVAGYSMPSLANPFLRWERTQSVNLGFEVSAFKDITLTLDLYKTRTHDLLINVPIPPTSGFTRQMQNTGITENKGLEIQLSAPLIKNSNFSWDMDFNMSFNRNKVVRISDLQESLLISTGTHGTRADFILKEGEPVGLMYGYVNDGFYTTDDFNYDSGSQTYTLKDDVPNASGLLGVIQPGTIKFRDINNDNIIDTDDQQIIGDSNPKFFGGISQRFAYKGFDLNVFLNFSYGNSIYNLSKLEFTSGYSMYSNMLSVMNDRWHSIDAEGNLLQWVEGTAAKGVAPEQLQEANENAQIWKPLTTTATAFLSNSWAIEDGSFIRLNNVSLGYTLPREISSRIRLNNLRFFVTGSNLAVWSNYSGPDPEVDTRRSNPLTRGVDYSAYPRSRSFLFGMNVSF